MVKEPMKVSFVSGPGARVEPFKLPEGEPDGR
jgi:hypothetical protein